MSAAITAAVVGVAGSAYVSSQASDAAEEQSAAANDATALQSKIASEQWNKYLELYDPLERQMVSEAQDYANPENYAKAAGEASATVSQQYSKARDRLTRTPGLDPSSAAYQSSVAGLDLAQAASDATQQNAARQKVTDTAYTRKQSALALGKGLDATAASGLSSASSQSQALANRNYALANLQASSFGTGVSNVVNAVKTSGWLSGTNSNTNTTENANTTPGYASSDLGNGLSL